MTIVSILQQILAEAGDVGDTEYMAKKAFDGKLITVTGDIDALNDTIEFIVPNGKRFYFHSAKIISTGLTQITAGRNEVEADLKIDGTVEDTAHVGNSVGFFNSNPFSGGSGVGDTKESRFDVKGLSLVGDGIKKIEIENVLDNGTATATIIGFIEDTLTDPTLLAQSITVEASVAGETGDLPFLQERILSGNVFDVSGDIDAINDTIEYIVPNGKTAFLLEAKVIPNNTGSNNKITAALKIDGVKKDEAEIFRAQGTFGGGTNNGGWGFGLAENAEKFNVKTLSLVGDGAKKIEIENIADSGGAFATMSGYLIDT